MESWIVKTEALKKYYKLGDNTVKALDGVNFYVKEGEFGAWLYGGFTKEQRVQCENSEEIESVGAEGFCAYGEKTEHDDTLHTNFIWADETKWDIIQKPARTEMKGHYPKKENEILVTKEALKDCGFKNLGVGDTFWITYADAKGSYTKKFIISGLWDGYGEKPYFMYQNLFLSTPVFN